MFEITALPEHARPAAEVYTDDDKLYQFFLDGVNTYMLYNARVWNAGANVSLRDMMCELYETLEPLKAFGRTQSNVSPNTFYEKLLNVFTAYGYVGYNLSTAIM